MRMFVIWPHDIPAERNRGIYQRIKHISKKNEIILFTLGSSIIANEIGNFVTLYRMPSIPGRLAKYYNKLLFGPWCFFKALMLHIERPPDIIYAMHHFEYFLALLVSKITNAKWVIDAFHSPYYHLDLAKASGNLLLRLRGMRTIFIAKRILRYVDLALVMAHSKTEGFAKLLINDFRISPDKVAPIPDGVDLAVVNPENHRCKRKKGRQFNVFYIGAISEKKAYELINAIWDLKRSISEIRLTLVGSVAKRFEGDLLKTVSKLGDTVEYVGRLPHAEALELMGKADVCVCTVNPGIRDYQYSHPGKIFEYLALGKAVVATDLEGIRGIIEDGYNGLLYPAGNVKILAEKIKKTYEDKNLRVRLERNARESVKRFDWRILNKKVEAEFQRIYDKKDANLNTK